MAFLALGPVVNRAAGRRLGWSLPWAVCAVTVFAVGVELVEKT
jgi:hypothetical protein